jgi:hypothetical protein
VIWPSGLGMHTQHMPPRVVEPPQRIGGATEPFELFRGRRRVGMETWTARHVASTQWPPVLEAIARGEPVMVFWITATVTYASPDEIMRTLENMRRHKALVFIAGNFAVIKPDVAITWEEREQALADLFTDEKVLSYAEVMAALDVPPAWGHCLLSAAVHRRLLHFLSDVAPDDWEHMAFQRAPRDT